MRCGICQFICKTARQSLSIQLAVSGVLLVAASLPMTANATDMIWVQKSERLLHLIDDSRITATYPIALGANPAGHKQREGDSRTPEGLYFIDWRNPDSRFYLSLHISYPSQRDLIRAWREGHSPGSNIMIHGEPNILETKALQKASLADDWTDGCIALSNRDMLAVWRQVDEGTPILIEP